MRPNQGNVGFQGLSNLGVGRVGDRQGFGGFVFSASSQSFSLLIRALKAQGRVDILSRPQVQVMDNQAGFVQVGADFPYLGSSTLTATGVAQQSIAVPADRRDDAGDAANQPDGKVLMRVEPHGLERQPDAGEPRQRHQRPGVQHPDRADDRARLRRRDDRARRHDQQAGSADRERRGRSSRTSRTSGRCSAIARRQIQRREVLVIMTPHIMRSEADQARILAEESARMHWCLPDIARIHGHGMEVIGPASQGREWYRPVRPGMPGPGYYGAMNQPADSGMNPAVPSGAQPSAAQPFNPASAAPMTPTSRMPVGAQPSTVPGGPMTPIAPSAIPPVPVPGTSALPATPTITPAAHDSRPAGRNMPNSGVINAGGIQPMMPPASAMTPMGHGYQMILPPQAPMGTSSDRIDHRTNEAREGRKPWDVLGR